MSVPTTFARFEKEIVRLVGIFEKNHSHYQQANYDEASLRQEFLNPLFAALGWDVENKAGSIPTRREVEVESRTRIGGRNRRADYLFRTEGYDRFVCEAKKPATILDRREAFQAKRYAWNKGVPLAVLTDFEDLKVYVVGGRPHPDKPEEGEWKTWHYRQFPDAAHELWELLSRERVAAGAIELAIDALPKKAKAGGRAKQQWILKPDRSRALDTDFLNFLDKARQQLASDLYKHNDHADLLRDNRLNEAVHRILDRILFLRICEDRDIDTGIRLDSIVETWRRGSGGETGGRGRRGLILEEPPVFRSGDSGGNQLWSAVVSHFRALDRRPPSHVPFFNGNLFKPHFCEDLKIGNDWIAGFITELSNEESPYLFDVIPVEILGTIYERFLGKVVRPHGKGITVEEKPEVRKAGGVYYTPRYIVDYIVEQTVGNLVAEQSPEATLKIRILDPACGSGSFLIRSFERMCEHWQRWLTRNPAKRKKTWCRVDPETKDVHLTVDLKRRILTHNIFGVDLDAAAVEVTQLSLYLKMLEGENRTTLQRERELFAEAAALLPPLHDNIKCFNSLIGSDFSVVPDDLLRVNAGDWSVQFPQIMKAGGFDAVVGNPPYVLLQEEFRDDSQLAYFKGVYEAASFKLDTYHLFIERALKLCRPKGRTSLITPSNFLSNNHLGGLRRLILGRSQPTEVLVINGGVFEAASVDTAIMVCVAGKAAKSAFPLTQATASISGLRQIDQVQVDPERALREPRALFTSGVSNSASDLWDRIVLSTRALGTIADVNFGKQLRDRNTFLTDVIKVQSKNVMPDTHVPCVTGKDVERYFVRWSNLACLNDRIAQCGGCWDEAKHGAVGKLLTRQIGRYPTFGIDVEGFHCLNTIFMVTLREDSGIRPEFLLGVLNSRLLRALWIGRFYDQRKTFPKIKGTYLKELPIPTVTSSRRSHDILVALVDKMLALVPRLRTAASAAEQATLRNAITATDQQIDALVYELYGLSEEEIRLVEGVA